MTMCLAVPGRILEVHGEPPLGCRARVTFGGVVKDVSLAFVPEAQPGQYVLVHVGLALAIVEEDEARRTLEDLTAAGLDLGAQE